MTPEVIVEVLQERKWEEIYPEILELIPHAEADVADDVRIVVPVGDEYLVMFYEYKGTNYFELLTYEDEDCLQTGQFFGPLHAQLIVDNFNKEL